jgi:elongation factor Ts
MTIPATQVQELRERTGLGMMLCKKALEETGGDMQKAIENLRKQGEATLAKRAGKAAKEGTISVCADESGAVMFEVNSETDFVARNEDFVAFIAALGPALLKHKPADLAAALKLTTDAFKAQSVEAKLMELTGKIGEKITFRRFHIVRSSATQRVCSYVHLGGKIGVLVTLSSTSSAALQSDAAGALGKDLAMQVTAANAIAASRAAVPEQTIAKEKDIYLTQAQNSGKPEKIWDKIVEGKLAKFYEQIVLSEQIYIKDPDGKARVSDRIKQAEKDAGGPVSVAGFVRYERGAEEA